jgi:starch-binding outer membrane protein, SusD/RagB family
MKTIYSNIKAIKRQLAQRQNAIRLGSFKHLLIVLPLLVSALSCTKLNEDPDSFVSEENYYKTVSDAESALSAIYWTLNYSVLSGSSVQTPYNILYVTGQEFMADDIKMGPGATNSDVKIQSSLNHTAAALRVKEIWQQWYIGINRANIAIDKIPLITYTTSSDSALLKQYVLEAKFLRGWFYYNLARLFGDVPLILHETTSLSSSALLVYRTPVDSVYTQIISDFTDAEKLTWYYESSSSSAGRVTGAAAVAALAHLYFTRANVNEADRPANVSTITNRNAYLDSAIYYTNKIINGGYYGLFDDYADVFAKASKYGKEHIFTAQFNSSTLVNGNSFGSRTAALGISAINGTYADEPTTDLVGKFRSIDKRKAVSLTKSYTINGTTYTIDPTQNDANSYASYKYFDSDVPTNLSQSGINVPIIRFAEILLINAEANNELNGPNTEAYANYNLIRSRAGLPTFSDGDLTKDQFRDSLYLDRRLELNFEYHRWFDLIREIDADGDHILVKTLKAFGKAAAADKHYLYPIPQVEIDVDPNLTQNTGW